MNKLQIQVPASGQFTRIKLATALCIGLLAGGVAAVGAQAQTAGGNFKMTGAPKQGRVFHTATLLGDGTVLVAGGQNLGGDKSFTSAELYDPATGEFKATGSMKIARSNFSATKLKDGRVLVVGGNSSGGMMGPTEEASAELYNRATGQFQVVGSVREARTDHVAVLLPNGQVLILGGRNAKLEPARPELYSPATGKWMTTGALLPPIDVHSATVLPNGKVLVVENIARDVQIAEIYDPTTGKFSRTGKLVTPAVNPTVALLRDGQVLFAGGSDGGDFLGSARLYHPKTGRFAAIGEMTAKRSNHTMTVLPSGKVLICGGSGIINGLNVTALSSAELYDPATRKFSAIAPMKEAHSFQSATQLRNGQVLLVGGYSDESTFAGAELYMPDLAPFNSN